MWRGLHQIRLADAIGALCFSSFIGRDNWAHIVGVVVRETNNDTPMAMLKTTANSRNSRPTMPPIMRMGIKTATSEVLMERTVKPISRDPENAA